MTHQVNAKPSLSQIGSDDFVRRFSIRASNLMWFLGAGASAAAGVPTAIDMVWQFKQELFVSQRKIPRQTVTDLSNPFVRDQLQAHIDSLNRLPPPTASGEYAALFEEVYPSEKDRRSYLDAKVSGAKPSYGHLALATMMRAGRTRLVWTTNFDTLVADACAKIYGSTGSLTSVTLDTSDLGEQVISENRWPVEVKLHGDFRSRRLKNTSDELRQQDVHLRKMLIASCRQYGLVVVGYSGRDDSIMDTLYEAVQHSGAFPGGLFWLHRGEDPPSDHVTQLLSRADKMQVEALLVHVENFDEVLRDIILQFDDIDTTELNSFATERRHWTSVPSPAGRRGWPVVRLNALPVIHMPSVCRRLVCDIGGTAKVREAIEKVDVDVIAARSQVGVLAFGADSEVRAAFESHGIREFDLHTFETKRQRYESSERGLLREALTRAIARHRSLKVVRRGNVELLVPADPNEEAWEPLRTLVGPLAGTVKQWPELRWHEGIGIRLDWADDRLWLLIEPRTVFEGTTDDSKSAAADLARERAVKRYNKTLNSLVEFWAQHLAQEESELRALGIGDGIDAVYRLSSNTSFSWRSGA